MHGSVRRRKSAGNGSAWVKPVLMSMRYSLRFPLAVLCNVSCSLRAEDKSKYLKGFGPVCFAVEKLLSQICSIRHLFAERFALEVVG